MASIAPGPRSEKEPAAQNPGQDIVATTKKILEGVRADLVKREHDLEATPDLVVAPKNPITTVSYSFDSLPFKDSAVFTMDPESEDDLVLDDGFWKLGLNSPEAASKTPFSNIITPPSALELQLENLSVLKRNQQTSLRPLRPEDEQCRVAYEAALGKTVDAIMATQRADDVNEEIIKIMRSGNTGD
ncbi:hypothetical protein TWF706_010931 [Orbilia oligospora]|nr:hypothetical protein TWF706_010931 [Orbilia oligospora]KAF3094193.1 hypothetical protein TWF103_010594 [Orbilia oligospora]